MPSYRRTLTELVLLGLLAGLLAYGVSAAIRTAALVPPPGVAAPAATARPAAPLDAYAVIAARDVFNPAPAAGDGVSLDGLRLLGVGMHGDTAQAVVDDGGRQRLHRIGDELRGARIAAISWDRLTLVRGGVEAVLELARPGERAAGDAARATEVAAPAPTPTIRRTGATAWIVDRRELSGAVGDMSGLMTQLRAVAEVEDGRPAGFRLFKIADDSIFRRLGLENGDVVQRVNGREVADPASLLAFLQRLRTEPRVALDIVRGGSPRTLVYDLR
jgi:general secretion pathway protein C